jgi:23S rRNA pseudouridine2605 synthase
LTSEQLLATRATLWRQKGEPLLTLDDAQSWLLQTGLCLFLSRKAQIPAPAPSFVEACLGETTPTPLRAAIEAASNLLARLIEANSAVPLNLLGTPSDHPDFLVSIEALPFVYALRGDRDWKHAPGAAGANRVSPLITHVWKLLESRGVLTATEIQEELGKELTEAAVLRALHELWASLRVIPLYQADGQDTLWEPLQSRHQKAMTAGIGMSQVTALSVLASVYLQSVVAASGDDAESFLSPLASRAKVREVIRGLTATRQLSLIQMETQSLLYVEGSLPEFPEAEKPVLDSVEAAAKSVRRPHPTSPAGMEASLRRSVAGSTPRPPYKRPAEGASGSPGRPSVRPSTFRPAVGARPDARKREGGSFRPAAAGDRPAFRSSTSRPSAFKPKSAPVVRSEPGTGLRADGSPKKPRWRDMPGGRPDQKGKPARFGPRKTEGAAEEKFSRPAPRRESGEFRPAAGSKPPYKRSSSPTGGKPFRPAASGRSYGADRPAGTGRSTGSGRAESFRPAGSGGATRPTRPSYGGGSREGARPPSRPFNTGRPPIRSNDSRSGSRPPSRSSDGRFTSRSEAGRPFNRPRVEGGGASRTPREGAPGGDRKFTPRPPRPGGFSSSRPSSGGARPYSPRSGAGRPSTGRPSAGGSSYSRSSSTGRPPSGRPPSNRPPSDRPPSNRAKPGKSFGDFPARKSGGAGAGSRPPSRGGFASGSRPGGGRPGPGGGRPKTGFEPKPGGRPPSTFKKRPE